MLAYLCVGIELLSRKDSTMSGDDEKNCTTSLLVPGLDIVGIMESDLESFVSLPCPALPSSWSRVMNCLCYYFLYVTIFKR